MVGASMRAGAMPTRPGWSELEPLARPPGDDADPDVIAGTGVERATRQWAADEHAKKGSGTFWVPSPKLVPDPFSIVGDRARHAVHLLQGDGEVLAVGVGLVLEEG